MLRSSYVSRQILYISIFVCQIECRKTLWKPFSLSAIYQHHIECWSRNDRLPVLKYYHYLWWFGGVYKSIYTFCFSFPNQPILSSHATDRVVVVCFLFGSALWWDFLFFLTTLMYVMYTFSDFSCIIFQNDLHFLAVYYFWLYLEA